MSPGASPIIAIQPITFETFLIALDQLKNQTEIDLFLLPTAQDILFDSKEQSFSWSDLADYEVAACICLLQANSANEHLVAFLEELYEIS